jgi:hypothetical protein
MPFAYLKLHFRDVVLVVFDDKLLENGFARPIETVNHRFMDFKQVVFCSGEKAVNRLSGLFNHLKNRLIEFTKITFYDIQKAENVFAGHLYVLKHRFIDII